MEKLESVLAKAKTVIRDFDEDGFLECCRHVERHTENKTQKNGKTLLENLFCVLDILLDLNPDDKMLKATILYKFSPISGTKKPFPIDDELQELIESLSKITNVKIKNEDHQIAALRKMFVAMAKDIRVVMMLLAERLCKMRSLEFFPEHERQEVARETLYIYAPIAGRLGIFALKAPLEDLAFFYLHPEEHRQISEQMMRLEAYRERIIRNAEKRLDGLLKDNAITGNVSGRVKHTYSVYRKMRQKDEESVENLYDIFAIRVVVKSIAECYSVLGILHEHFVPLSGRFKDYIAVPKPNGYRSLHTTVVGLSGVTRRALPIEVQIRTEAMNLEAEYGIAAHWHYKEKGSVPRLTSLEQNEQWLEELSEMESSLAENSDFTKDTATDELFDRIFALTPTGDVIDLPINATPIDFAFAIHSDLGLHIRIAKANGKSVPLNYIISSGDVIEIVTSKQVSPSQAWITMCTTSKAKGKLKAYFREKDTGVLLREGKQILNRYLQRFGFDELDQNLSILREYNHKKRSKKEREEILLKIGNGSMSPTAVIKSISTEKAPLAEPKKKAEVKKKSLTEKPQLIIGGRHNIPFRLAECCKPKVGDALFGFVTRGAHVTIHRLDCRTRDKLDPARFLEAYYEGYEPKQRAMLQITRGLDRVGFVRDITEVIAGNGANISNFAFRSRTPFAAVLEIEIEIENIDQLLRLTNELEHVEGVEGIARTE